VDARLAALWNGAYNLGAVIGPLLWGSVDDARGFEYMCEVIALNNLVFAVVFLGLMMWLCRQTKKNDKEVLQDGV
jgi:MFS family permease